MLLRSQRPPVSRMRMVVIAIVASIMSILVFKYVDGTFGNSEVAATAEQLSED